MAKIKDLRSMFGSPGHPNEYGVREHVATVLQRRRAQAADAVQPVEQFASRLEIAAEINAGRWIARCPFCIGAEAADPVDPRFYCLSCFNADVDHKWVSVKFPEAVDKAAIEAVLEQRAGSQDLKGWLPGETVEELQSQNAMVESRLLQDQFMRDRTLGRVLPPSEPIVRGIR